ncbi:MAG: hypothetical protein M3483_04045 [Gemmatimonadota bacterium]|nr:hypothetical protein [Gemmatimonadota bacterium]
MTMRTFVAALAALFLAGGPAGAQAGGPGGACPDDVASRTPNCILTAQALVSAQPQLGILLAGGNPTIGTASTGGIRLGILPRFTSSVKVSAALARIPDILEEGGVDQARWIPLPAVNGTVSVGLFSGTSLGPTVGGFGAVDLLGSLTWVPLTTLGIEGFEESPPFAYGLGARIGVLRESFTAPGVSLTFMRRRLGRVGIGDVCPGSERETIADGGCPGTGDPGEISFDLTDWSGRLGASKRVLGWGLAGGLGYDHFTSDADFAYRSSRAGNATRIERSGPIQLEEGRWSAYANASLTSLFASLVLEAGWMQGGETISGYPASSDFDPEAGTFFGSLGLRLAI